MIDWLKRAGAWLLGLLALAAGLFAAWQYRWHDRAEARALGRRIEHLNGLSEDNAQRANVENAAAVLHAEKARLARRQAKKRIKELEDAGKQSMAELVARWNRGA